MRSTVLVRLAAASVGLFAITAGAQVQDGSFEQAVVPANGNLAYQYSGYQPGPPTTPAPAFSSPWTFGGGSGLINGTGTDFNTPSPFPNGVQVAFLQGNGSFISQMLGLSAGTYTLSFSIAGRQASGSYDGDTAFDVSFGGNSLLTGNTTSFQQWTPTSITFTTAGNGLLAFSNTSAQGDHTFFLDDVNVTLQSTATPEPASLALLGTGLLGLAGVAARRRRRS